MVGRFWRAVLLGGSEMILAVVVVLVLALAFMGILTVAFPEGSGLVYLYDNLVDTVAGQTTLQVTSTYEDRDFVAELTTVERRVRDRPASAVAWRNAREGLPLEDHHTVQTLARSRAAIEIAGAHKIQLGEKSLVVIKRPEGRSIADIR